MHIAEYFVSLFSRYIGLFKHFYIDYRFPYLTEALFFAIFVAAASGGKGRVKRKVLLAAAATVLLYPPLNHIGSQSFKFSIFSTILSFAILFLCSRLCGEKRFTRSVSLSVGALNIGAILEAIFNISYFEFAKMTTDPEHSSTLVLSLLSPTNKWWLIAYSATICISLGAAAIYLRKKKVSLDRRGSAAVAVSLLISNVMITLLSRIIFYNRRYVYTRVISLSLSRETIVLGIIILIGILTSNLIVYHLITKISRQNKLQTERALMIQQYSGQSALFEEVARRHGTVSKMRHDLTAAFGTVNELIKSGKYEEATDFIEKQTGRLSADVRVINTDNEYVNSLISYETARAKEVGVDVSVYTVSSIVFPDDLDLCNLIGNMFDNAIRAASECDGAKTVRLDICLDNGAYRITMLNSVKSPVMVDNPTLETTKPDKVSHGFGTKIIKEISEKYHGTTDFYDTADGKFCCSVLVYPEKPY